MNEILAAQVGHRVGHRIAIQEIGDHIIGLPPVRRGLTRAEFRRIKEAFAASYFGFVAEAEDADGRYLTGPRRPYRCPGYLPVPVVGVSAL